MGDRIIDENATIAEVAPVNDQMTVLSAAEKSVEPSAGVSTGAAKSRPPLQDVTPQMSNLSFHNATHDMLEKPVSTSPLPEATGISNEATKSQAPVAPSPHSSESIAAASASQTQPTTAPEAGHEPIPKQEPTNEPAAVAVKSEPSNDSTSAEEPAVKEEPETEYQPREQANPFVGGEDEGDNDAVQRGLPLAALCDQDTPERLEAAVKVGLKVLADLEKTFEQLGLNEDAQVWLRNVGNVRKDAEQHRTIVGVVGNTGAGKSSVINAMLDEERLVPTNCMRACTAVVTELSYNSSSNPAARYRAEIEFIQPQEWEKELAVLYQELFDDSDNFSPQISNADSQAGVAYAKIRAVYHTLTREDLKRSTVASRMNAKMVRMVLGTTVKINSSDPFSFYMKLQQYVDSKEKGTEKLDKNGNITHNQKREFEHWPLIKAVRIYVKSPALATGAVIVDLPGVHDSNAARAAVAEKYIQQCTGLWIVAPITRAVDDKAAKTLLGDTFKRQLKFDGAYSAVTFICSKTDDISRVEAEDGLGLRAEMSQIEDQQSEIILRQRDLRRQKDETTASLQDHEATIEKIDEDTEVWEDLWEQVANGKTVWAPDSSLTKKRKSLGSSTSVSKRRRTALGSGRQDNATCVETAPGLVETVDSNARTPLTEEDVEGQIDDFKHLKKATRREKNALSERMREIQAELNTLHDQEAALDAKKDHMCIEGRNEYSRRAIQQDFAAGVRELDQETQEEQDPENFNPDEDLKDYDAVARSLPVFCVSSRAYQKLSGRFVKDNAVPGFETLDQTGIPELQVHCKALTVKGRQAHCRRFLNGLKQLLTSLALWASDDGTGAKLTDEQRDEEKSFMRHKLKKLEKALEKLVDETLSDAASTLRDELFTKIDSAVRVAVVESQDKVTKWGGPKDAGGLHHGSYKATVRRDGVWTKNFNDDLAEPLYKHIASPWEKLFQRKLPSILLSFQVSAGKTLKQFHAAIDARAQEKGHGAGRLQLVGSQLASNTAIFGDLCTQVVTILNEGQREVNRAFTPAIQSAMAPAYGRAAQESGKGMFLRMKGIMSDHIDSEKDQVFNSANRKVRGSLQKLCKTIKETMASKTDEVYCSVERDYLSAMCGVKVDANKMSRGERAARRQIDQIITGADAAFKEVLDTTQQDLKPSAPYTPAGVDEDEVDASLLNGDDVIVDEGLLGGEEREDEEHDEAAASS